MQSKRRINEILRDYWEQLRAGRPYPSESEIDPDALHEIWDHCFLAKVGEKGERDGYRYAYLGTSLMEAMGDDPSQTDVSSQLINPAHLPLVRRFKEVAAGGKPAIDESEFTNKLGMLIKYRSCMLPLAGTTGEVGYILGGMKWKAF